MTLLIGERYRPRLQEPLCARGTDVLWLPDNPDIDPRLAGHADLCVYRASDRTVFCAQGIYDHFVNYVTNRGYELRVIGQQGSKYPADAGLCLCAVGHNVIYNERTADPAVLPYLSGTLVDVPQGYTKCSVCVVSDDAIITADDVIARRAASAGLDVLKISPGHIVLEGFDTGFIGGASFLIADRTLVFTGTLDMHPDADAIDRFLAKHGVRAVYLTDEPVFDIGGAVALP